MIVNGFRKPMELYNDILSFPKKLKQSINFNEFVKNFDSEVPYLNYIDNEEFTNPELYINTLFFNLRGRKIFTQKVLSDIKF